ncbi:MAG: type I restriction endonuclease subunit R [Desulfuromonadales bacterium]|nr:type I restriction endonuclease subunit R [Desulfuromonadales bacterium]
MTSDYSENNLVEQPTIALLDRLGWTTCNCYEESFGSSGTLGRKTSSEVVLRPKLLSVLQNLNSSLPTEAHNLAIEELTRDRSLMTPVQANREIHLLLKNGVKVTFENNKGEQVTETIKVIDWNTPENNDFFLASQFWVTGEMYKRRADLIGFVNGLPLIFIELKASHKKVENAFNDNLKDYKNAIPQLFWYNAFIILSNGSQSRIGSLTAEWEHFAEWKKINDEGEEGKISLETMIRGICDKAHLLDLVENFILFSENSGGMQKLVAKNHQYLGVNRAVQAVRNIQENQGRLGVFWHTQGSGKSYSMVFFSQKVLRKLYGNWTFVIVTDRQELDGQIYKNFANCGVVTEEEKNIHAQSATHLQELLREDHRFVFTLIQKFRTDKGETYPKLSDRSDIIVITDEAHRSQYDTFALNMRNALPNAAFIGFTGTPLMAGEELTRKVFGEYVSIYNFKQSVEDNATVPLYYENRIPELQLTNENLNEDMENLLETAMLDEAQEQKLEREFSREYHLVTRDDRLEKVAEDVVQHFANRGQRGKAMFIAIDKLTAVRMCAKVQAYWQREITHLKDELSSTKSELKQQRLLEKIAYMEETDMAVVVSQAQNELELFAEKGIDFKPHRLRMVREDLEKQFKDADNPFRLVFVCAMWITGFDVPCCNTIYLDKPMRNHTLMQTIARANRVFKDKLNGLIVDYVGVFRNMQKALAIYGSVSGGDIKEGECPVKVKAFLVEKLRAKLTETENFLKQRGVDLAELLSAKDFDYIALRDEAVEAILASEESKKAYMGLANWVKRIYKAILPDPAANEFGPKRAVIINIAEAIKSLDPEVDISEVMEQVEGLLDESIATEGYIIRDPSESSYGGPIDISQIDFGALKKQFEKGKKRTEIEKLKAALEKKLKILLALNRSRMDYLERFQRLIDEYNSGARNIEESFAALVKFAQDLNEEERRHVREEISEEELAVFDLLFRPPPELTDKERRQVKKIAMQLLEKLKQEKLVLDWRKKEMTRASVRQTIEILLDELPEVYSKELYDQCCEQVYQHVYDAYWGKEKGIYTQ